MGIELERKIKDPDAVLDYGFDWSAWLGTDTISTSSWDVPTGLTEGANGLSTQSTSVWISGGSVGRTYTVTNRVVTAAGRTDDRSFLLYIAEK